MIIEVWVVITGNGDRPFCHARQPRRELVEKWHREEGGVRVFHIAAKVPDVGAKPTHGWASVFEEPTPNDPERWAAALDDLDTDPDDSRQLRELRQAIDEHLGWPDAETEERGDYVAWIIELGKRLARDTEPASDEPKLDPDGRPKLRYSAERHGMTRCQDHDGECVWKGCPRKLEPGRYDHCPLDICPENDEEA